MQIQVIQADKTEFGLVVIFENQIGIGKGIWNGIAPQLRKIYGVEFEIRERLVWGQTIFKAQETSHKISFMENTFFIVGQLNHIYWDGVVLVAVETSLIMMATTGTPAQLNDYVHVTCHMPVIYDTNY